MRKRKRELEAKEEALLASALEHMQAVIRDVSALFRIEQERQAQIDFHDLYCPKGKSKTHAKPSSKPKKRKSRRTAA